MIEREKAQHPAGFEPTASRVLLCRPVLYRCATTAAQQQVAATHQLSLVHDGRHDLVDVVSLLLREVQDVEGVVGELQILVVVDGRDRGLALADVVVVVDVVGQAALLLQIRHCLLHQLVEDVVRPLHVLLEGDPGLLKQVGLDVATRQLALGVEVDADELTLDTDVLKCVKQKLIGIVDF